MSLPPLATVADLQAHLQRELPAAQADLAIRRASARVRSYTQQTISFVANDVVEVDGGDRTLRVPQRPLVVDDAHPLTVVELGDFGGLDLTLTEGVDYTRLGGELTRGYPTYWTNRLMGWPHNRVRGVFAPRVRLTYSHGYQTVPDDIMDVVLALATTNVSNVLGLRSESIDDYSVTYATETVGDARLNKDQKEELRGYRKGAFSVTLS
ncbi:hypothetical protein [Nonomuraea pusilla]|uniref:Phage gp6-like head-tail connector protein n=1 Tax=Nonomuraea pusilla TaxID=46177 RepID=A0A1H8K1D7_9ACTN|nr:hypothetical protein [Nonomuraea pusilla]SEN86783.1 hypothetical protein SAMN05660976_08499 [Nonomuraea pusilla]